MRSACEIMPDEQERITLEKWSKGRRTPVRIVMRAKTVILDAASLENRDIDVQFGIDPDTPGEWQRRFLARRLAGIINNALRDCRKPMRREEVTRSIVKRTTEATPADATHWSTRTLGKESGVGPASPGPSKNSLPRLWTTFNNTMAIPRPSFGQPKQKVFSPTFSGQGPALIGWQQVQLIHWRTGIAYGLSAVS